MFSSFFAAFLNSLGYRFILPLIPCAISPALHSVAIFLSPLDLCTRATTLDIANFSSLAISLLASSSDLKAFSSIVVLLRLPFHLSFSSSVGRLHYTSLPLVHLITPPSQREIFGLFEQQLHTLNFLSPFPVQAHKSIFDLIVTLQLECIISSPVFQHVMSCVG